MAQTCGSYLSQFALSVDSVDVQTYNNIKNLLDRYFARTLNVSFYAILVDGIRVDASPGLRTLWSNRPVVDAIAVLDPNGEYCGMRSYAYHKDRTLWITAEDRGLLGRSEAVLKDAWSNASDLPKYLENGETDAKTAMLVPLRYGGRVFGVLVLELPEYFECSSPAKEEIRIIADALARVIWLHETTEAQLNDTHRAFHLLEELFNASSRPLTKPGLFMANPVNSDDAVVGYIRAVLGELADSIELLYWKAMSEQGNINTHILKAISSSQYGICYLSERDEDYTDEAPRFRDNPNVLFEAGMLQALTNDPAALPVGWIPIREHPDLCGPPPFDFAQERMIVVPRTGNHVNEEEFKANLRRMIRSLVGQ